MNKKEWLAVEQARDVFRLGERATGHWFRSIHLRIFSILSKKSDFFRT
jgi:hypothetical protein